jgi:hypothetical protein
MMTGLDPSLTSAGRAENTDNETDFGRRDPVGRRPGRRRADEFPLRAARRERVATGPRHSGPAGRGDPGRSVPGLPRAGEEEGGARPQPADLGALGRRERAGDRAGPRGRGPAGREGGRRGHAAERTAFQRADRSPSGLGRDGSGLSDRAARLAPGRRRLVVAPADPSDRSAPVLWVGCGLGPHADRCVHPRRSQGSRPPAVAGGRPCRAHPPRHLRPHRAATDPRAGRRFRRRPRPDGLRDARGSAAGLAALRRALGPTLARRGPVRRERGL